MVSFLAGIGLLALKEVRTLGLPRLLLAPHQAPLVPAPEGVRASGPRKSSPAPLGVRHVTATPTLPFASPPALSSHC